MNTRKLSAFAGKYKYVLIILLAGLILLLLPGGSLVYLLFCVTKWGWGFDKYTAECNTGSGPKMPQWVKPYFKYVLPVLIAVILVQGLL